MATESTIPEKVSNLDYLKELSNGNEEFVREMIDIFLAETPAEIDLLDKAIRTNDYPAIKQTAHKLRSTIPFVGLHLLIENEVCEIETLAEQQTGILKIEGLFTKVRSYCQKAHDELKAA